MEDGIITNSRWMSYRIKQDAADEFLLAEVVRDVIATLLSRGSTRQQAILEGYKAANELVRLSPMYTDRPVHAQIMIALHVFRIAQPPHSPKQEQARNSVQDVPQEPRQQAQEQLQVEKKRQGHLPKYRGRRSQQKRIAQAEHDAPLPPEQSSQGGEKGALF